MPLFIPLRVPISVALFDFGLKSSVVWFTMIKFTRNEWSGVPTVQRRLPLLYAVVTLAFGIGHMALCGSVLCDRMSSPGKRRPRYDRGS